MKPIGGHVKLDQERLQERVSRLTLEGEESLTRKQVRRLLSEKGLKIKKVRPENPGLTSFTACDASILKREYRYNAVWAAHTVTVRAAYDGKDHPDNLAGRKTIRYRDIKYESRVDLDVFQPYASLDERLDSIRENLESKSLIQNKGEGDVVLFDGSLAACLEKTRARKGHAEHETALKNLEKLAGQKLVSMVEDTHTSTISRMLGFNTTDLLLFQIALEPGEYVSMKDVLTVCYIKLPGKKTEYTEQTDALTVKWEFTDKAIDLMPKLAWIWLEEDDLIHPQLYPLRIADYLTRKIKVSGIIEEVAARKNLQPKNRELRTL